VGYNPWGRKELDTTELSAAAAPSITGFLQNKKKKLCGRKSGVFIFLFSFLYCLILKKLLF